MNRRQLMALVPSPPATDTPLRINFDTDDIINAVLASDMQLTPELCTLANSLQGDDDETTCYNIWQMMHDNLQFIEDPDGLQDIRMPKYLVYSGQGDCKSFSLLTANLLQCLGIPYDYKFTGSRANKPVHHVYIVACPDSDNPVVIDRTNDTFNTEPPDYVKYVIYAPPSSGQ